MHGDIRARIQARRLACASCRVSVFVCQQQHDIDSVRSSRGAGTLTRHPLALYVVRRPKGGRFLYVSGSSHRWVSQRVNATHFIDRSTAEEYAAKVARGRPCAVERADGLPEGDPAGPR